MKMHIIIILTLSINFFGCEKDDSNKNTNILGENWKALSIILENNQVEYEIINKDYFNQYAYLFYFNLDSTFDFNTSVNSYGGELNISHEDKTLSLHIISGTRVGQPDDNIREIDSVLVEVLKSTTSFQIIEDKIDLIGYKGIIKLKKMTNNE
jgi:hypothetical protein